MTFRVRKATIDDLERLVSFTLAEAWEAEGLEGMAERIKKGVHAGLTDPAVATYWVLEDSEASIVGSISVVREWSDWRAGNYWWIQSVYIQPEFRGRGLMKRLMAAVREAAKQEEALELRLYVHDGNARAIRAYKREGFAEMPYQIMAMKL